MIGDWEQFSEMCAKLCYEQPDNILAAQCQAFYTIARQGDMEYGAEKLDNLIQTIEFREPKNAHYQWKVSQLFSRISGRNQTILSKTMKLLQRCR